MAKELRIRLLDVYSTLASSSVVRRCRFSAMASFASVSRAAAASIPSVAPAPASAASVSNTCRCPKLRTCSAYCSMAFEHSM